MTRFQRYIKQVEEGDQGFTLIELMVVVLIIGILMAIAIPTFLSAKKSANAAATESNIQSAITAEQTYFTQNQNYATTVAEMKTSEPGINWTAGVGTSTSAVYFASDGSQQVVTMQYSGDTKCYYALDTNGTVDYMIGTKGTACSVPATAAPGSGWSASWKDAAAGTAATTQPTINALTAAS